MDTTKLVFGQKVWMQSGDEREEVTVLEITEKYIEVEATTLGKISETTAAEITKKNPELAATLLCKSGNPPSTMIEYKYRIRFDKNGEQAPWDSGDRDFGVFELVDAWDPRPLCTKEGGPYRLVI